MPPKQEISKPAPSTTAALNANAVANAEIKDATGTAPATPEASPFAGMSMEELQRQWNEICPVLRTNPSVKKTYRAYQINGEITSRLLQDRGHEKLDPDWYRTTVLKHASQAYGLQDLMARHIPASKKQVDDELTESELLKQNFELLKEIYQKYPDSRQVRYYYAQTIYIIGSRIPDGACDDKKAGLFKEAIEILKKEPKGKVWAEAGEQLKAQKMADMWLLFNLYRNLADLQLLDLISNGVNMARLNESCENYRNAFKVIKGHGAGVPKDVMDKTNAGFNFCGKLQDLIRRPCVYNHVERQKNRGVIVARQVDSSLLEFLNSKNIHNNPTSQRLKRLLKERGKTKAKSPVTEEEFLAVLGFSPESSANAAASAAPAAAPVNAATVSVNATAIAEDVSRAGNGNAAGDEKERSAQRISSAASAAPAAVSANAAAAPANAAADAAVPSIGEMDPGLVSDDNSWRNRMADSTGRRRG